MFLCRTKKKAAAKERDCLDTEGALCHPQSWSVSSRWTTNVSSVAKKKERREEWKRMRCSSVGSRMR